MADHHDYVSTRTRSKARLGTNKAIMSKESEEGGDSMSPERLASVFLMFGIVETSEDEAENEPIDGSQPDNQSKPLTFGAALRRPHAMKWKGSHASSVAVTG